MSITSKPMTRSVQTKASTTYGHTNWNKAIARPNHGQLVTRPGNGHPIPRPAHGWNLANQLSQHMVKQTNGQARQWRACGQGCSSQPMVTSTQGIVRPCQPWQAHGQASPWPGKHRTNPVYDSTHQASAVSDKPRPGQR
jgi:hypothetical protein